MRAGGPAKTLACDAWILLRQCPSSLEPVQECGLLWRAIDGRGLCRSYDEPLHAARIDAAHAMSRVERRLFLLQRLAWLCVATVLAVTSLSAFIRLSNTGLGCAPWPQCYGERGMRAASAAGVKGDETAATQVARTAHRVMAVLALLIIVLLVLVCFSERPRLGAQGRVAVALLALALFLAVLGRWSSGSRVPAVSIANLIGGFAMLALSLRLAVGASARTAPLQRGMAAAALLLLIGQVALGVLIGASQAALSCVGWSDCTAAASAIPWSALDPWQEPLLSARPPFNAAGALPQSVHRRLAQLLVLVLLPLALVARRSGRRRTATLLIGLLAAQVLVGLAMVQGSLPLGLALLHNLIAACLLATLVLLA
jgi:cytochrome c oxidase assembly protein subunit 15